MEQTLFFHVRDVWVIAMTEGMETAALPWMELKQFVHPPRAWVQRHMFFLVLAPHFVEAEPCPHSYQLLSRGWELGQTSSLPYKIAVVQKAFCRLHHICWPKF